VLFHATVVLLQSIVEIRVSLMENVIAQDLVGRMWGKNGAHPWSLAQEQNRPSGVLAEKVLGGLHISLLAQP
jgi:hypothetical protein